MSTFETADSHFLGTMLNVAGGVYAETTRTVIIHNPTYIIYQFATAQNNARKIE